jgi:hypothetical protein
MGCAPLPNKNSGAPICETIDYFDSNDRPAGTALRLQYISFFETGGSWQLANHHGDHDDHDDVIVACTGIPRP